MAQPAGASTADARSRDCAAWLLVYASAVLNVGLAEAAYGFSKTEGWTPHGFARSSDHATERLLRSGRWLRDLAALGRGLEAFPVLRDAVLGLDGEPVLLRVHATVIARALRARCNTLSDTEWIALGRRVTVAELKQMYRAVLAGAPLEDVADAGESKGGAGDGCGLPGARARSGGDALDSDPDEDEEEDVPKVEVVLELPKAIRALFHDTYDLHQAVSGANVAMSNFIESLVAEACAGPVPPDVELIRLRRQTPRATIEAAFARATDNWRALREATRELGEALRGRNKAAASDAATPGDGMAASDAAAGGDSRPPAGEIVWAPFLQSALDQARHFAGEADSRLRARTPDLNAQGSRDTVAERLQACIAASSSSRPGSSAISVTCSPP